MDGAQDQRIREQAYALWEKEGRPEGRDVEFWERARAMVETEGKQVERPDAGSDLETDEASKESFPASDPPAFTADVGARADMGESAGRKR